MPPWESWGQMDSMSSCSPKPGHVGHNHVGHAPHRHSEPVFQAGRPRGGKMVLIPPSPESQACDIAPPTLRQCWPGKQRKYIHTHAHTHMHKHSYIPTNTLRCTHAYMHASFPLHFIKNKNKTKHMPLASLKNQHFPRPSHEKLAFSFLLKFPRGHTEAMSLFADNMGEALSLGSGK